MSLEREEYETEGGRNWVAAQELINGSYFVRHMNGNRCPTTDIMSEGEWRSAEHYLRNFLGYVEVPFTVQHMGDFKGQSITHYPVVGETFLVPKYGFEYATSSVTTNVMVLA